METVYLGIATAAFILCACFFVAAVVVFFKRGVADAIRYLQNKPVKSASHTRSAIPVRQKGALSGLSKRHTNKAKNSNNTSGKAKLQPNSEDPTEVLQSSQDNSESPTELLGASAVSERATQTLSFGESESPTRALSQTKEVDRPARMFDACEESERPTRTLDMCEESERPTLPLKVQEESERLTRALDAHEESERPTSPLDSIASAKVLGANETAAGASAMGSDAASEGVVATSVSAPAASTESTERKNGFTFVIRQQCVVTHTNETI